jgi:hypothetical protein
VQRGALIVVIWLCLFQLVVERGSVLCRMGCNLINYRAQRCFNHLFLGQILMKQLFVRRQLVWLCATHSLACLGDETPRTLGKLRIVLRIGGVFSSLNNLALHIPLCAKVLVV